MSDDAARLEDSIAYLKKTLCRLCPTRVLVVEDDPLDLELMSRELAKFMCTVTTCLDGTEAVDKIKNENWDLIILDLNILKLTGSEVLEHTVGHRDNSRVIVVTGNPPWGSPTIFQQGVVVFVKPITDKSLEVLGLVRL